MSDTTTLTLKDFQSDQEVRWCPCCSDYVTLKLVQVVSGTGCSNRHGQAPASATEFNVSRPDLEVRVITGDGDGALKATDSRDAATETPAFQVSETLGRLGSLSSLTDKSSLKMNRQTFSPSAIRPEAGRAQQATSDCSYESPGSHWGAHWRHMMKLDKTQVKILILDDIKEVRNAVRDLLAKDGYRPDTVGSATDLLSALKQQNYHILLLDIQLDEDESVIELYSSFQELFPTVVFSHQQILGELCIKPQDTVSGRYLLPMVKAISPSTEVLMLTGAWEGSDDEQYLIKWGSFTTVLKGAFDYEFSDRMKILGLDLELLQFIDQIADKVSWQ